MDKQVSISREIKSDSGHFEIPLYPAEVVEVLVNGEKTLAFVVPDNGTLKCYFTVEKHPLQYK